MMTIDDWLQKFLDEGKDWDEINDFIFIVDDDGVKRPLAAWNFNGGTCGCCQKVNPCREVIRIYNGITLEVVFSEY